MLVTCPTVSAPLNEENTNDVTQEETAEKGLEREGNVLSYRPALERRRVLSRRERNGRSLLFLEKQKTNLKVLIQPSIKPHLSKRFCFIKSSHGLKSIVLPCLMVSLFLQCDAPPHRSLWD